MNNSTSSGRGWRILFLLSGIGMCSLIAVAGLGAEEGIKITLKNFLRVRSSNGQFIYSPIVEQGIPACKHILVVTSCRCLDDATDDRGNAYYFYMVDRSKELKALVTAEELDPVEQLEEEIRAFVEIVRAEMKKDGGIASLIEKFENQKRRQVSAPMKQQDPCARQAARNLCAQLSMGHLTSESPRDQVMHGCDCFRCKREEGGFLRARLHRPQNSKLSMLF